MSLRIAHIIACVHLSPSFCYAGYRQYQGFTLTLLVAVTMAYVIGIRSLPLPNFALLCLSSNGRHHISPTGLTFQNRPRRRGITNKT